MYSVIAHILKKPEFQQVDCAVHVVLSNLCKDDSQLSPSEQEYAHNPRTHIDFLMFHKMGKEPILAIELDGTSFHQPDSKQAERDAKKDAILKHWEIPLLRIPTDSSNETEEIEAALKEALSK